MTCNPYYGCCKAVRQSSHSPPLSRKSALSMVINHQFTGMPPAPSLLSDIRHRSSLSGTGSCCGWCCVCVFKGGHSFHCDPSLGVRKVLRASLTAPVGFSVRISSPTSLFPNNRYRAASVPGHSVNQCSRSSTAAPHSSQLESVVFPIRARYSANPRCLPDRTLASRTSSLLLVTDFSLSSEYVRDSIQTWVDV